MVEKGPLTTMKLGSTGMSTSHWCAIVALWFAPGTKEGHETAQSASTLPTYSFQSRILPTGYKGKAELGRPTDTSERNTRAVVASRLTSWASSHVTPA